VHCHKDLYMTLSFEINKNILEHNPSSIATSDDITQVPGYMHPVGKYIIQDGLVESPYIPENAEHKAILDLAREIYRGNINLPAYEELLNGFKKYNDFYFGITVNTVLDPQASIIDLDLLNYYGVNTTVFNNSEFVLFKPVTQDVFVDYLLAKTLKNNVKLYKKIVKVSNFFESIDKDTWSLYPYILEHIVISSLYTINNNNNMFEIIEQYKLIDKKEITDYKSIIVLLDEVINTLNILSSILYLNYIFGNVDKNIKNMYYYRIPKLKSLPYLTFNKNRIYASEGFDKLPTNDLQFGGNNLTGYIPITKSMYLDIDKYKTSLNYLDKSYEIDMKTPPPIISTFGAYFSFMKKVLIIRFIKHIYEKRKRNEPLTLELFQEIKELTNSDIIIDNNNMNNIQYNFISETVDNMLKDHFTIIAKKTAHGLIAEHLNSKNIFDEKAKEAIGHSINISESKNIEFESNLTGKVKVPEIIKDLQELKDLMDPMELGVVEKLDKVYQIALYPTEYTKLSMSEFKAIDMNKDIVNKLVEFGAYIDETDSNLRTSLYPAIQLNRKEIILFLLRSGADIYKNKDSNGLTPWEFILDDYQNHIKNYLKEDVSDSIQSHSLIFEKRFEMEILNNDLFAGNILLNSFIGFRFAFLSIAQYIGNLVYEFDEEWSYNDMKALIELLKVDDKVHIKDESYNDMHYSYQNFVEHHKDIINKYQENIRRLSELVKLQSKNRNITVNEIHKLRINISELTKQKNDGYDLASKIKLMTNDLKRKEDELEIKLEVLLKVKEDKATEITSASDIIFNDMENLNIDEYYEKLSEKFNDSNKYVNSINEFIKSDDINEDFSLLPFHLLKVEKDLIDEFKERDYKNKDRYKIIRKYYSHIHRNIDDYYLKNRDIKKNKILNYMVNMLSHITSNIISDILIKTFTKVLYQYYKNVDHNYNLSEKIENLFSDPIFIDDDNHLNFNEIIKKNVTKDITMIILQTKDDFYLSDVLSINDILNMIIERLSLLDFFGKDSEIYKNLEKIIIPIFDQNYQKLILNWVSIMENFVRFQINHHHKVETINFILFPEYDASLTIDQQIILFNQ
jgi:hypothetical protein